MFEELTVEPGSFVYLIRFLCWRKPKWKSHHSLREFAIPLSWKQPGQQSMSFYLSEGEWDTLKSKQGLVLCLRGRACVLCLSECASGGMLQQRTLSSTTDEESKLVLFFLFMLIEGPRYVPVLSRQGEVSVLMALWGCVSTFACLWVQYMGAYVCALSYTAVSYCSSMVVREAELVGFLNINLYLNFWFSTTFWYLYLRHTVYL